MPESYSETTKTSYGKNIMNSFGGVVVGIILFLLSFVVLWINEGHNVEQIGKADYISRNAIEISADKPDRANDGKLVQLSGKAETNATLSDETVTMKDVFALSRKVEMYQWDEKVQTETKDNLGGSTTQTKTYSYEKVWSDREINSDDFKKSNYVNPKFPVKSDKIYAETGKLGGFNLTAKQTKSMGGYLEYKDLSYKPGYRVYENYYYKGYNPENPTVGDIRISYEYIPSGINISVIGKQKNDNTISDFPFKNSAIYLQQAGTQSKDEMVASFRKGNTIMTNIFRFVGWLMMFIGLSSLSAPIAAVSKVLPFLKNIVNFISGGISFLVSLILSLLTISIAWIAYRPLIFAGILAISAVIFFVISKYKSKTKDKVIS